MKELNPVFQNEKLKEYFHSQGKIILVAIFGLPHGEVR